jgi:nucleoside-diphosphate-sugar epimerase
VTAAAEKPANRDSRPVVLITGAAGNLGRALAAALAADYRIVGLDRSAADAGYPILAADFANAAAVELALRRVRDEFGARIASVVHLVAYFDQTGEDNPLYRTVNVEGTRNLLRALQAFEVQQFVFASTMLVHAPVKPGEHMDEDQPFEPAYIYPQSKLEAEEAIKADHGRIPYVILRLAGVYDEKYVIPTLAQQMARIHGRDLQGYLYAGSLLTGQSMLHKEDMIDAFRRTIERRASLPSGTALLIGEPDPMSYDAIQDEIGYLIHGAEDWPTLRLPRPLAAAGAWGLAKLEPVIPDAIDRGEEPAIRPYMAMMGNHHYALDIRRARELLGWEPAHRFKDDLPAIVTEVKRDPVAWYRRNGITPPEWVLTAHDAGINPETLRQRYEAQRRSEHARYRWAHFVNIALGTWLLTSPALLGIEQPGMRWSEVVGGAALIVLATIALSWRPTWARWGCASIGFWLLFAPLVFWTSNAAVYLNDTLVGTLIIAFAVALPPEPGVSPLAATTGPETPPGWSYNPSAWTQRLPIIALALVGLYVSRYLAAYQLGLVDDVWEPFFQGSAADPQNGTEEIITSHVAEAWPISDGGLGAITYILEILTGVIGLKARWRTMPWLVVLFGLMIVPLSITSISFVIIQPIVIGTWGTLTLIGAAAMLLQIPYAIDELLASLQFLRRRVRAGKSLLRVFLAGDTDEPAAAGEEAKAGRDEFERSALSIVRDVFGGGVSLPWNLALSGLIASSLLFTRLTVGSTGAMAHADHVIGFLVLTTLSIAAAEPTRAVRYLNVLFGVALLATPFVFDAATPATLNSIACGIALILLSRRRGPILQSYGKQTASSPAEAR